MEYIEPKPVEEKPHAKRNRIIITSVVSAVTVAAVGVGAYFLIDKVFLDFNNIEFFNYAYVYDDSGKTIGSVIVGTNSDHTPPKNLRIPRQLGGAPVIEIADDAIAYYPTIETVNFPDTIKRIGAVAFEDCINLRSFNVPRDLESIGTDAFNNTAWLEDHEDGEVMVGKFLYSYKGKMENDTILVASEDSVLISQYPQADVINLGNYTHMSNGIFRDQSKILAVEYPDRFEEINDDSFTGCDSIEKIIIPESIKYIGTSAFEDCFGLSENPDLSHVEYIAENAFANSNISGELTIGEATKYIGGGAFMNNEWLRKVTLNNNLNAINEYTFFGCTRLDDVVFSENEYDVTKSHIGSIGSSAFASTAIDYMEIPYNTISIQAKAFANCPNLTGIKLYNNTSDSKYISRSFDDTTREFGEWTTSESTYQGISVMGVGVFEDSSEFKEIVLVNSDETLSASNKVSIPLTLSSLGGTNSREFANTKIVDVDLVQELPEGSKAGKRLTMINSSLFEDAKELVSVRLGSGIVSKSNVGSSIEAIADNAFKNCVKLESISIPASVKRIDSNVFDGCSSLATVTYEHDDALNVNSSVTGIKDYNFHGCTSLTSVVLPVLVTEIGKSAFEGCTSLTTILFSNDKNLQVVSEAAFKDCTSLTSIVLPSSTRSIATKAFQNCTSLENLALGVSITSLSANLIDGCTSLITLTLNSKTVVKVNSADLDGNHKIKNCGLTKVIVPSNLVESYQADEVWSNYVVEAIPAE